ncbi:hypothetical protein [Nocardia aurantiaca]|uniref:Uncharacterized protein n=1 Tax=Nocardia aurantiaca TaxID=2675850 RepID=A0A6I3L3W2_9NOCA|nr:hypothetical protein [Nocardia aurantiaca]MTE16527.1 hypothetical protein [Nocardia aurantiaca]
MEREQNLSQDARRKAGDERAATRRADRHRQLSDMNLIREESGGDYEPLTRGEVRMADTELADEG